MKKFSFSFLLIITVCCARAQTDPIFSHYMFNPAQYNPAWLGDVNTAFGAFQYRNQWTGFDTSFDGPGGAPNTQLMTLAIPMQSYLNAVGSNLILDTQGAETTLKWQVSGAYNLRLKPGVLSFGIMPGVISRTIRFDEFRFEDPSDPLNTGSNQTQISPDLAAGVFFKTFSGYFAGAAVDHILQPRLINIESSGIETRGKLDPVYYFHGGKSIQLNRDLDVTPSFIVRTDLNSYTVDVSGVATYRDLMWAGLSYRRAEAAVLLIGYNFLEDKTLQVGYSFYNVIRNQAAKQPTSHEIFIRYNLPDLIIGGRKPVKTPRFSF